MASFTIRNGIGGDTVENLLIHVIYDDDAINALEGTDYSIGQMGGILYISYTGCISAITLSANWGTVLSWENHVISISIDAYPMGVDDRTMRFTVEWCDGTSVIGTITQVVEPCLAEYSFYLEGANGYSTAITDTGINATDYGGVSAITATCKASRIDSAHHAVPAYPTDTSGDNWTSLVTLEFDEPSRVTYLYVPYAKNLTAITIPSHMSYIEDYAFVHASGATSLTINSQNIQEIGLSAFSFTTSIQNGIILPSTLTKIKQGAFRLSGIKSVFIPSGVTVLGAACFGGSDVSSVTFEDGIVCVDSSLDTSVFPSTYNGYGVFGGCSLLQEINFPNSGTLRLGDKFFLGCTSLSSLTIPSTVNVAGNSVFAGCTSLTSLVMGDGYNAYNEGTFSGCTALEDVSGLSGKAISVVATFRDTAIKTLDLNGVTFFGTPIRTSGGTFHSCRYLSSVTFGEQTEIPSYCFGNCTNLQEVNISSSITAIGKNSFSGCTSLKDITIPSGVTSIGEGAFEYCSGLSSVTLSSGLATIDTSAFASSGLKNITIPNTVSGNSRSIFYHCSSLTSVTFESGGTNDLTLGSLTFADCPKLREVTFGSNLVELGSNLFTGCTALTSVTFVSEDVPVITSTTFAEVSDNIIIYVPSDRLQAYKDAPYFSSYSSRIQAIP